MATRRVHESEATSAEERLRWWDATGQNQLRQLLYWRWDPIGVSDHFPNTFGEYDDYADSMKELMVSSLHDRELEDGVLAAALRAQQAMGFERKPGAAEDRREVVELILEWRNQSLWMWREFGRG